MSVRKVYQVLVDGSVVFSGSYRSCLSVYEAFTTFFGPNSAYVLSLAFQPSI